MMPTFPIPLFAAVLLSVLALHLAMRDGRSGMLAGLVGLCALQSLLLSLVQHYGLNELRPLQPLLASVVPGFAYVCFVHSALRPVGKRETVHVLGLILALCSLVVLPNALDLLVPILFAGYGVAILRKAGAGPDALPRTRLGSGDIPGKVWRLIGSALLASALSDMAILAAHVSSNAWLQPWIVSFATTAIFVLLGWVALSPELEPPDPLRASETARVAVGIHDPMDEPELDTSERDAEITSALAGLLDDTQLFLDPDLSLDRLSRRMGLPRKTLSAAINRTTGENVSRFINRHRIDHACAQLMQGARVTDTWLNSGFNTKSNFNREFSRLKGCSPSQWLAKNKETPKTSFGVNR
ncbi:helix-turn-helix domain-containing protein [Thalassococcus lentus]|uniref:Helix-turn-helix domain-containing protein n=1 Tax=Thalassococcus lentus TaxID=1210524 RepID=A0ABT4XSY8_9RHOB|nr:helix-turn-helix domain-containing protein [Thalassococcus lentus]MDA7425064.1 helix-turn-helix domain-containing protein [Thalassococcus lentus]